ncbi:zinc finger protein 592 [Corythoichthys intestinalis]|uniref:zinc finger protein 592 n=1 Tax=Corythoichthys intestinalis TaxID=161448 RepID=UPI0025A5AE33|nr:zinc finger protein 592 [Corythoichthys intestinalis]XP_057693032.1 zinc finger protein 592 [Corythoichthys intestinalis]XP_057693033.1 zinc finger protein 592 [Corythoichthys intestinalis]XP_061812804.1 zinc finger protein 592-like [Nerophis lumbriciformis]
MGDMKTPDFDDLLAAFDIPDATGLDAKEPIQEGHDETHLKHPGVSDNDSLLSNEANSEAEIPTVSVIVKNTHQQEPSEGFGDGLHSGPILPNGFNVQSSGDTITKCVFDKSFVSALNGGFSSEYLGKAPIQHKPDATPLFSQSHSHSSPEYEGSLLTRDKANPKQERSCFQEESDLEPSAADNPQKLDLCIFNELQKDNESPGRQREESPDSGVSNEMPMVHSGLPHPSNTFNETNSSLGIPADGPDSFSKIKSYSPKVPSCLEALVALNARKDPTEQIKSPRESPVIHSDCMKYSPKVSVSPRSPMSPLEAVKRMMKPPDSPVSICSDSSSKAGGSPPVPKVRIKTIKTTSGQVKRTVTSVLPDSETDDVHSAYESSPSQSLLSEDGAYSPKVLQSKSEERPRTPTVFQNLPVRRSPASQACTPKKISSSKGHRGSPSTLPKAAHLASLNLVPHSVAASVTARSALHQSSQNTFSSTVCSTVPLVHQIKTWPRTSVHNTAADTLNQLLNNVNPVPTYVPNLNPPPKSDIRLPARGYRCHECGDSFSVERSLTYHYNRRSVHIEVGCTHCAKTIVFFNKCALLAHAREHKSKGAMMQCTQLHMKPIAEAQMFVPFGTEPLKTKSRSTFSRTLKSQPVMPLYPDNAIRHRMRCLECNKQMSDLQSLAGHYQSQSEDTKELFCKLCSMLLPNKCSFKSHQRIHALKPPYTCPECGAISRSADIQKHVRENCLHYARKAWFKCLHCEVVFKTLLGQKTHIEEKHCAVLHKCSICLLTFKSENSYEAHMKDKHSASKSSPQFDFKCSCGNIFQKKWLLFQHFHQDANKRLTCVFKCPECNSVFSQKQPLMQHFKSVHGGEGRLESEVNGKKTNSSVLHQDASPIQVPEKNKEVPQKKTEKNGGPRMKSSGWTCGECLQYFPERDLYASHLKSKHGKSYKRYACGQCNQSFNSSTNLRRHIRRTHDGKNKIYSCWYCTDRKTTFSSIVLMKNHISLMHGIRNPDLSQMPKTSIHECKNGLGKDSPEAPSAKRAKRNFHCSKCRYITDDYSEFHKHITQHKSAENTPQCLHCGLCFTSMLSLSRHLVIVHKGKNPKEEEEAAAKVRQSKANPAQTDSHSGPIEISEQ